MGMVCGSCVKVAAGDYGERSESFAGCGLETADRHARDTFLRGSAGRISPSNLLVADKLRKGREIKSKVFLRPTSKREKVCS